MNNITSPLVSYFALNKYRSILVILLLLITVFSLIFFEPKVEGDGVSYVESIEVMRTGIIPSEFIPNRIVSTFLSLNLIRLFSLIFSNLNFSWMLLNTLFYISVGMVFYFLMNEFTRNEKVSLIVSLFLATNYSLVSFGLAYLMDIGGWTFYVISLYFSFLFLKDGNLKWMWYSSFSIGVGGLFKEYAFLGYVVLVLMVLFEKWREWSKIFKYISLTFLISFVPILLVNLHTYSVYNYTYLSWYRHQEYWYINHNILTEYVKSFGSLFNFAWFLFLPGFYILIKKTREDIKNKELSKNIFFVWAVILSAMVVAVWPVVTRVLFITVPALALVSSFYIREIVNEWWLYLILVLYGVSSFLMDSFILDFVNLPF